MPPKFPNYVVEGQPELSNAFKAIADALNSIAGIDITPGYGIGIRQTANGIIIENTLPRLDNLDRALYPKVIIKSGTYGVGLTPGKVVWPRRPTVGATSVMGASIERTPYIDDGAETPLTNTPEPHVVLSAGDYDTWALISREKCEIKFVLSSADPSCPDGFYAQRLNSFTLSARSGGVMEVNSVVVYEDMPIAWAFACVRDFTVTMVSATSAYVAAGKVVHTDWSSAIVAADPKPLYVAREKVVSGTTVSSLAAGTKIYCKLTYVRVSATDGGTFYAWYVNDAVIIASATTPTDTDLIGHVLLAEVVSVTDTDGSSILEIKEHHSGVITAPSCNAAKAPSGAGPGTADGDIKLHDEYSSTDSYLLQWTDGLVTTVGSQTINVKTLDVCIAGASTPVKFLIIP